MREKRKKKMQAAVEKANELFVQEDWNAVVEVLMPFDDQLNDAGRKVMIKALHQQGRHLDALAQCERMTQADLRLKGHAWQSLGYPSVATRFLGSSTIVSPTVPKWSFSQGDDHVTIAIYAKKLLENDISVAFRPPSRLCISHASNAWAFNWPLYRAVEAETMRVAVDPYKVEVRLRKVDPRVHWPRLDREEEEKEKEVEPRPNVISAGVPPEYPTSRPVKTDWTSVEKVSLADEKKDREAEQGDQGLMNFFRSIYNDADEDTRRAMIKSYQTSNGVALSTNWKEVEKTDYSRGLPSNDDDRDK
jgi:hypothetical protein